MNLKALLIVFAGISLIGCATTKLDSTGIDTDFNHWVDATEAPCEYGKPRTSQGNKLCHELYVTDEYRKKIEANLKKTTNETYDYPQILLAVLGSAALAASSHVSVLESLGILTAATIGLKSYSNVAETRGAERLAIDNLHCIAKSTSHLIWDDRWYYSMLSQRYLLYQALVDSASIAEEIDNTEQKTAYLKLTSAANKALELADNAKIAYGGMSHLAAQQRSKTLSGMQDLFESTRGDISSIVSNITNAKAISASAIKATQETTAEIEKETAENTPTSEASANGKVKTQASVSESVDDSDKEKRLIETPSKALLSEIKSTSLASPKKDYEFLLRDGTENFNSRKLDYYSGIISEATVGITSIAPRYINASSALSACVIK